MLLIDAPTTVAIKMYHVLTVLCIMSTTLLAFVHHPLQSTGGPRAATAAAHGHEAHHIAPPHWLFTMTGTLACGAIKNCQYAAPPYVHTPVPETDIAACAASAAHRRCRQARLPPVSFPGAQPRCIGIYSCNGIGISKGRLLLTKKKTTN